MVKGLVNVLEALQGDTVTIELKNGSVVTGTLANVDVNMTAHLTGAKVVPVKGEPEQHDELTVRGMNVRMFLLGDSSDIDVLLRKAESNEKRTQQKQKTAGFRPGAPKPAPKMAGKVRQRDE